MPLSRREIQHIHRTIREGLALPIPTYEILRRYEFHYDRLAPYLNESENFHLMSQFARHENYLSERTGLSVRPTEAEISRQAGLSINKSKSKPVSTETADPFNLGPPTVAGNVTTKRKRTPSEEHLAALESINWDEDFSPPRPPSPPPPPPSGGAITI